MLKPASLRGKLNLATIGGVGLLALLFVGFNWADARREQHEALKSRAGVAADLAASAVTAHLATRNWQGAQSTLAPLLADPDFFEARLLGMDGQTLLTVTPARMDERPRDVLTFNKEILSMQGEARPQLMGRLDVIYSRDDIAARLARQLAVRVLIVLMLLALLAALQSLVIRTLTRPLEHLATVVRRRSEGKYDDAAAPGHLARTDEIGDFARSLEQDQKRRRDEKKLLDATAAISTELDLDRLLAQIMDAATNLLDADRSSLFILDPTGTKLISKVAQGLSGVMVHLPTSAGIVGAAWSSGQPVVVPDVTKDRRFDSSVDKVTGYQTKSVLAVPLIGKNGAQIGVAQVLNKKTGAFDDRDADLLCSLAAQAAAAIENARLFEEVAATRNYNESILRSLSSGVISFDEGFQVAKVNAAAETMIGLSAKDLRGRGADDVFRQDNAWVDGSIRRVMQERTRDTALDTKLLDSVGEEHRVNLTAEPLMDSKDRIIGALAVIEDITGEKRMRSSMARYLPKPVVDQLMDASGEALVGTTQRISILFTDIRGFTDITERIGARQTVAMLNEYFAEMVEIIDANGGVLDKFIGDAIMALFGVPFPGDTDAGRALTTAGAMIGTLQGLNVRRAARGERPIGIGIGINTGEVVLGNIGSPTRMDYTVIGDPVNLAARLEAATKLYGTPILVSEFTYDLLTDKACLREVDMVRVKGKKKPVRIFESLGHCWDDSPELAKVVALTGQGLARFRARDWNGAEEAFRAAQELRLEDRIPDIYLERIAAYRQAPPTADWDGVFTMKSK
ncbi:MAG: adenylate/guanylate cyclase domain-containing protein [Rhodospirillales bacterium]